MKKKIYTFRWSRLTDKSVVQFEWNPDLDNRLSNLFKYSDFIPISISQESKTI